MRNRRRSERQKGFSLPETLIAAVIAAGVVAAAAQSIGASVRLARAVDANRRFLSAAETITARLRVGMSDDDALDGFPGWSVKRESVPPFHEYEPAIFDRVALTSEIDPERPIEFWAPTQKKSGAP